MRTEKAVLIAALLLSVWSGLSGLGAGAELPVRTDANGYEIIINLAAMELHLYRHGVPVKTYPIGIGNVVSPSRLGSTRIVNVVAHPTYYPPDWYVRGLTPIPPGPDNPVGTRWLGLDWPGYGIHGTNNPASIGTAASAGCIRMYNEDVEELASLVGIGTPVTFVYEPVEVWTDRVTGRTLLRVHRDIYSTGQGGVDGIKRALVAHGVPLETVSEAGLRKLAADANGQVTVVPTSVPVYWEDQLLTDAAFRLGGQTFVSLSRLADRMNEALTWARRSGGIYVYDTAVASAALIDGELFGSVESAAAALGLIWQQVPADGADPGIAFSAVRVMKGGTLLSVRGRLEHAWVLLPVRDVAALFGISVGWDPATRSVLVQGRPVFGARIIDDRAYLPHDRLAQLLDLPIEWHPEQGVVVLDAKR